MAYLLLSVDDSKEPSLSDDDAALLKAKYPGIEAVGGEPHVYRQSLLMGRIPPETPQCVSTSFALFIRRHRLPLRRVLGALAGTVALSKAARYYTSCRDAHLLQFDFSTVAAAQQEAERLAAMVVGHDLAVVLPLAQATPHRKPLSWADQESEMDFSQPLNAFPEALEHDCLPPGVPSGVKPVLKVKGWTALPLCPTCLERLDTSISGVRHMLCTHLDRCECHFGTQCRVCLAWRMTLRKTPCVATDHPSPLATPESPPSLAEPLERQSLRSQLPPSEPSPVHPAQPSADSPGPEGFPSSPRPPGKQPASSSAAAAAAAAAAAVSAVQRGGAGYPAARDQDTLRPPGAKPPAEVPLLRASPLSTSTLPPSLGGGPSGSGPSVSSAGHPSVFEAPAPDPQLLRCVGCGRRDTLWACLVCGFIGCGRYTDQHTLKHCFESQHTFVMELTSQKVWDYEGDLFIHRLLIHQSSAKDVLPDQWDSCEKKETVSGKAVVDAKMETKQELACLEYSHLLAHQMESARVFHEARLAATRCKADEAAGRAAFCTLSADEQLQREEEHLAEARAYAALAALVDEAMAKVVSGHQARLAEVGKTTEAVKREHAALKVEFEAIVRGHLETTLSLDADIASCKEELRDLEAAVSMRSKCSGVDTSQSITFIAQAPRASGRRGRKR